MRAMRGMRAMRAMRGMRSMRGMRGMREKLEVKCQKNYNGEMSLPQRGSMFLANRNSII